MQSIDKYLQIDPFALDERLKHELYLSDICDLTSFHYKNCPEYRNILNLLGYQTGSPLSTEEIPFIPARLFKEMNLLSVDENQVLKTMTSSGTSSGKLSKIYLDKVTSRNQTAVLTKIVTSFVGAKRMPMIIIDSKETIINRKLFSARGSGILGFQIFGRDHFFALNEKFELESRKLVEYLRKYQGETVLIFGFTYLIWSQLLLKIRQLKMDIDLSNCIMIHGGGWKKLSNLSISEENFKADFLKETGLHKIHNYYGMVEQTGSIHMECEYGNLHSSIFSDIFIRDFRDFSIAPNGTPGLIQLLSLLPTSYPGHSILTEDQGVILGVDNCKCKRRGKYFKVFGRIKDAEARGCSDAYGS